MPVARLLPLVLIHGEIYFGNASGHHEVITALKYTSHPFSHFNSVKYSHYCQSCTSNTPQLIVIQYYLSVRPSNPRGLSWRISADISPAKSLMQNSAGNARQDSKTTRKFITFCYIYNINPY
jgi:hypothetical protein